MKFKLLVKPATNMSLVVEPVHRHTDEFGTCMLHISPFSADHAMLTFVVSDRKLNGLTLNYPEVQPSVDGYLGLPASTRDQQLRVLFHTLVVEWLAKYKRRSDEQGIAIDRVNEIIAIGDAIGAKFGHAARRQFVHDVSELQVAVAIELNIAATYGATFTMKAVHNNALFGDDKEVVEILDDSDKQVLMLTLLSNGDVEVMVNPDVQLDETALEDVFSVLYPCTSWANKTPMMHQVLQYIQHRHATAYNSMDPFSDGDEITYVYNDKKLDEMLLSDAIPVISHSLGKLCFNNQSPTTGEPDKVIAVFQHTAVAHYVTVTYFSSGNVEIKIGNYPNQCVGGDIPVADMVIVEKQLLSILKDVHEKLLTQHPARQYMVAIEHMNAFLIEGVVDCITTLNGGVNADGKRYTLADDVGHLEETVQVRKAFKQDLLSQVAVTHDTHPAGQWEKPTLSVSVGYDGFVNVNTDIDTSELLTIDRFLKYLDLISATGRTLSFKEIVGIVCKLEAGAVNAINLTNVTDAKASNEVCLYTSCGKSLSMSVSDTKVTFTLIKDTGDDTDPEDVADLVELFQYLGEEVADEPLALTILDDPKISAMEFHDVSPDGILVGVQFKPLHKQVPQGNLPE